MNESLLNTIIKTLIVLESGGDPDKVDGDKVGVLGITKERLIEANSLAGGGIGRWNIEPDKQIDDRLNPTESVNMCEIYLRHYMRGIETKGYPDIYYVGYAAQRWTAGPTGNKWISGPNGYKENVAIAYGNNAKRVFRTIQALERIEKLGLFDD